MAKSLPKITTEWGSLLEAGRHSVSEDAGNLWRTKPVSLETFVMSKDYLKQDLFGMSEAQKEFLKAGSDFESEKDFFVLFVGKGGGKNWVSAVLFLYVVYKLLCMYDPHKYLNHNRDKAITLLNVAINAKQAKNNFFNPMASMLRNAGEKAFRPFGFTPSTDIRTDSISFPQNIEIISANSQVGGTEGYDILMALADEIDDVQFYDVDRSIDTLRTSAKTRFKAKAKVIVISYRRYIGSSGKIVEYYTRYRNLPNVFARRYASWEFHPTLTEEDFASYFTENPEKAGCMLGSELGGSMVDSWIKDAKRIKNAMRLDRTWIFDWPLPYESSKPGTPEWYDRDDHGDYRQSPASEHRYTDEDGVSHVLDPYDIPIKEFGNPKYKYVLCGDPALGSEENGGDGYGITLGHRVMVRDDLGKEQPRVVVDFAFRFTGRMFEEKQVQMVAIQNLIEKLKDRYGYNIRIVSMDSWNSASTLQWVAKKYKDILVYNSLVKTEDYNTLRDCIFGEAPPSNGTGEKERNGGIDVPWNPILYEEWRQLLEDKSKQKVDHRPNGSKDISDTVAKLSHILVRKWPFADLHTVGMDASELSHTASRVKAGVASSEELKEFNKEVYSDLVGLSRVPRVKKTSLRLEDILDVG